ncbi:LAFE_0G07800g1_1 [Lachancea fermentati]|uniref:Tubulin-specific chaperone A n=1 Tax=Lachancea fermentati TaxID=4955 RepID=A0A1G4MHH8_LACFM|nr:LAFE_0G07800g1_1 [Lachancea fermentati]
MAPTQLEIKVRALQRLVKEEAYYQQDLKEQKERVNDLKSKSEVDPYDLKKQVEVLQDTERLLPTLYDKINQFREDLNQFVQSYKGTEDTAAAKDILKEAEELLKTNKH